MVSGVGLVEPGSALGLSKAEQRPVAAGRGPCACLQSPSPQP